MTRKCSHCGQSGHNARTCVERGARLYEIPFLPHLNAGRLGLGSTELHHDEQREALHSESSLPAQGQNGQQMEDTDSRLGPKRRAEHGDASGSGTETSQPHKERKKGAAWSEEEHRLFLLGLHKLGKGDWRGISRHFVQTRTPTQVASHAQKYFIRQSNLHKRKRRSSLFDLAPASEQTSGMPPGLSTDSGESGLPGVAPGMLPPQLQAMGLMPGFAAAMAAAAFANSAADPALFQRLLQAGAPQLNQHTSMLEAAAAAYKGNPFLGFQQQQSMQQAAQQRGPAGPYGDPAALAAAQALQQQQQALMGLGALSGMGFGGLGGMAGLNNFAQAHQVAALMAQQQATVAAAAAGALDGARAAVAARPPDSMSGPGSSVLNVSSFGNSPFSSGSAPFSYPNSAFASAASSFGTSYCLDGSAASGSHTAGPAASLAHHHHIEYAPGGSATRGPQLPPRPQLLHGYPGPLPSDRASHGSGGAAEPASVPQLRQHSLLGQSSMQQAGPEAQAMERQGSGGAPLPQLQQLPSSMAMTEDCGGGGKLYRPTATHAKRASFGLGPLGSGVLDSSSSGNSDTSALVLPPGPPPAPLTR